MEKTRATYLNLPYTRELVPAGEGGWLARIKELPGCISRGDTPEAALALLQDAMALWVASALEDGMAIPEPRMDEDYSGKFVVRVPRSMHRWLVERAEADGVSLNQWIVGALGQALGQGSPDREAWSQAFMDRGEVSALLGRVFNEANKSKYANFMKVIHEWAEERGF
jgi:antitoxin HicB